jgi:hypothetical protein
MSLSDDVRAACAGIAASARSVRIDVEALDALDPGPPPVLDAERHYVEGEPGDVAAYMLALDAINFGSGWFPTLRKAPGVSGFRTVEAGLRAHGPWSAGALAAMTREEIAAAVGQDPGHELMGHFAVHLRELGEKVRDEHGGSFLALARSGDGSAVRSAEQLASWPTWRDVSPYDGDEVPFFKRAQIAAADLALAGIAPADDLDRLTIFADNLVPHVLRIDGVLRFDDDLVARIEAEQLIEHDSPEEVEIRACALHAAELLVAAHGSTTAAAVDNALWHRGGEPRYKAVPRHRARTTAY